MRRLEGLILGSVLVEAGKAYVEAWKARDEAWKAYVEAIDALHALDPGITS